MKKITQVTLLSLIVISACKKEFDTPVQEEMPEGPKLSIQTLKQRCNGTNSIYRFSGGDTNLYATVTMDENSGNIYKTVFVKDEDGGALCLKLKESGGLSTGDKIRINLNFCYLVCANNMISIDSLDIAKSIVKISSGNAVTAKVTSIDKILAARDSRELSSFQSQLIELNDVEFVLIARGKPFANSIGKTALEYKLSDCARNEIPVRTSGMSNFAAKLTPSGNGKFIGIVQQYSEEMTLIIRNYNDLQMTAYNCSTETLDTVNHKIYLSRDFNDNNISSGGWLNVSATGTTSWTCSNMGQPNYYARIYNKNSVYEACETWLISPEIDLTTAIQPIWGFTSANSSSISTLTPYILENYVSGVPPLTSQQESSFVQPKNSFSFTYSSDIPISFYAGKKIRVAYKYKGTATSGSIWEIDDVVVREKN